MWYVANHVDFAPPTDMHHKMLVGYQDDCAVYLVHEGRSKIVSIEQIPSYFICTHISSIDSSTTKWPIELSLLSLLIMLDLGRKLVLVDLPLPYHEVKRPFISQLREKRGGIQLTTYLPWQMLARIWLGFIVWEWNSIIFLMIFSCL